MYTVAPFPPTGTSHNHSTLSSFMSISIYMGVPQYLNDPHMEKIKTLIEKSFVYLVREEISTCKNNFGETGHCKSNPSLMRRECIPVCQSCNKETHNEVQKNNQEFTDEVPKDEQLENAVKETLVKAVYPKIGRGLLWVNVMDKDLNAKEPLVEYAFLPSVGSTQYGSNVCLHQRNYKDKRDCQSSSSEKGSNFSTRVVLVHDLHLMHISRTKHTRVNSTACILYLLALAIPLICRHFEKLQIHVS